MSTATYDRTPRVWAIEGCEGIGRHIAHRLLADGQHIVDVPGKLSARARVFATGQGGCSRCGVKCQRHRDGALGG